jgi:hypothetical protein
VAIFSPMYVDGSRGELNPPPYPMRFDLTVHEWWGNLGCVTPDGKVNTDGTMTTDITWTVIGEPFGNFAVCELDVDASWFGKYVAEQTTHEKVRDSLNVAPTLEALPGRCRAISQALGHYLDRAGVPASRSDLERSVNGLLTLDLSAHHPRIDDIRSAYIDALSVVPEPGGVVSHHWLGGFLLPEMTDDANHQIDFATLGAMRDCMLGHDDAAPCRALHYIYQLGVLATYLAQL